MDELQRFLDAQEGVFATALAEVESGRKRTHWMWFIFPQITGLGSSPMARHYAIRDLAEARAYLQHPVLGPRLRRMVEAALRHQQRTATEIFGTPDDSKLRSCATLFAEISEPDSPFHRVLVAFFGGQPDERTLERLAGGRGV